MMTDLSELHAGATTISTDMNIFHYSVRSWFNRKCRYGSGAITGLINKGK